MLLQIFKIQAGQPTLTSIEIFNLGKLLFVDMHVTPPNVVLYWSPEYDTHSPKQVSLFLSVQWIFCDGVC
jgi:hypothetical protein